MRNGGGHVSTAAGDDAAQAAGWKVLVATCAALPSPLPSPLPAGDGTPGGGAACETAAGGTADSYAALLDARRAAIGLGPSPRLGSGPGLANSADQLDGVRRRLRGRRPVTANHQPLPPPQPGHRCLDAVWAHPGSGARLHIGNCIAASDRELLREHSIGLIVVCATEQLSHHRADPTIEYLRFYLAGWPDSSLELFRPLKEAVEEALVAGHGVLVHCLAGAHRAGAVGVGLVMLLEGARLDTALASVKARRAVVDPAAVGYLSLLERLDHELTCEDVEPHQAALSLAVDSDNAGKTGEAQQLARQALSGMRRSLKPEHPLAIGTAKWVVRRGWAVP